MATNYHQWALSCFSSPKKEFESMFSSTLTWTDGTIPQSADFKNEFYSDGGRLFKVKLTKM